ncbi:MAG TPA: hypothetical protein VHK22_00540 [Gaiellaceae bacterium]|nr:hypothetical protein [Gaiellaceae bacterium]
MAPPALEPRRLSADDHHVLGLHYIRGGVSNESASDVGFLAFWAALVVGGLLLAHLGERRPSR